jgi:hypothetical protein
MSELEQLQSKLEKADQISNKLRHKLRRLTGSRVAMRQKFEQTDKQDWTQRIQGLISLD